MNSWKTLAKATARNQPKRTMGMRSPWLLNPKISYSLSMSEIEAVVGLNVGSS